MSPTPPTIPPIEQLLPHAAPMILIDRVVAVNEEQLQAELAAIDTSSDAQTAPLESITVQPKKSGIAVRKVALLWSSA